MFSKYILPPDVFFRHAVVARAIGPSREILDVGGSLGELRKFLPHASITTADVVEGADILFSGKKLPVENNSFETVVSVDTLEHVPQKARLSFVRELYRVAKKQVILLAPYGSKEHIETEKQLVHTYEHQGKTVPHYLKEHIAFGLPSDEFLRILEKEFHATTMLCGRLWFDRVNFAIHAFEVRNGTLNQLLYRAKFIWNIKANLFLVPTILSFASSISSGSRFLVTIEKV